MKRNNSTIVAVQVQEESTENSEGLSGNENPLARGVKSESLGWNGTLGNSEKPRMETRPHTKKHMLLQERQCHIIVFIIFELHVNKLYLSMTWLFQVSFSSLTRRELKKQSSNSVALNSGLFRCMSATTNKKKKN